MDYKHIIIFLFFLLILFILFNENRNLESFNDKVRSIQDSIGPDPKRLYDQDNSRRLKERINRNTDKITDESDKKKDIGWNSGFPEIKGEERYSRKGNEWHGRRGEPNNKGNWSWISNDYDKSADRIFNKLQNPNKEEEDNIGHRTEVGRSGWAKGLKNRGNSTGREHENTIMKNSKHFDYTDWGEDGKDIDE